MRLGLISDIHGNLDALREVLGAPLQVDRWACVGDIVGYGAEPNEVAELLRDRGVLCLRGNHDQAALGGELSWFSPHAAAALRWTRPRLTAATREFLEGLPRTLDLPEADLFLVHGSPRDPLYEYVVGVESASRALEDSPRGRVAVGHSHLAMAFTPPRFHLLADGGEVSLEDRMLLNPGSVGQPRDGNPGASCGVLDTGKKTFEVHRIAYDIEAAARRIREAGLPEFLASRLYTGV